MVVMLGALPLREHWQALHSQDFAEEKESSTSEAKTWSGRVYLLYVELGSLVQVS